MRNDTDKPVTIPNSTRLGFIAEYNEENCYLVDSKYHNLAVQSPEQRKVWRTDATNPQKLQIHVVGSPHRTIESHGNTTSQGNN
jgi:hypothetical protein